jgi:hypothetical protein
VCIHHTLVPITLPYQPVEMLNAFHFGSPVLAAVPARVPPGGASAAAPAAKGSSSNEADKGNPKAKGKGDAVDGSTKEGVDLVPGFLLAGGGGKHSGVANGLVRTESHGVMHKLLCLPGCSAQRGQGSRCTRFARVHWGISGDCAWPWSLRPLSSNLAASTVPPGKR